MKVGIQCFQWYWYCHFFWQKNRESFLNFPISWFNSRFECVMIVCREQLSMSISLGSSSSSRLLWTTLWKFELTLGTSIETWRILLWLRSVILTLKWFVKSWLVQYSIYEESQYLTSTCIFFSFQYRINKSIWHGCFFVEGFFERQNEARGLIQQFDK